MYLRWLAVTATAYVVCHHLGLLPGGLGAAPGDTQWADWIDLLVPVVVLAPAALTIRAARASEHIWWLFGVGALVYATGHGIHLAANSVGNADPSPIAHLWDERVGHLVWYAGVALVAAALVATMRERPEPPVIAYPLAALVGLTWGTNGVGGGTEIFSLVVAAAAATFGWRRRRDLGMVLLAAGSSAVVVLVGHWLADTR